MGINKIVKINKTRLLFFLLIIPFFPVQSINMLSTYNQCWTILYNALAIMRLVIAASSIAIFVIKKKKPNLLTWGIVGTEAMILLACAKNGSLTLQFSLTMCMAPIGFAMLCQEIDDKSEEAFLKASISFFGVLCFFGVVSTFLFPNGINHSEQKQFAIWFLGSKNAGYFYYSQYLFLLCFDAMKNRKQISSKMILYALLFVASTIICRSSNGTLMLLIILFGMISLKYKGVWRKIFRPRTILAMVIILALAIPTFSSGAFDWAFKIIGRTSDLSMRTYIWDSAVALIKERPIFGNGKDGDVHLFGGQTHAHNFYLDLAVKYGIITLVIMIITIVLITLSIRKSRNKELVIVGSLFLLTLLVHGLFDVTSLFYMILVLHYELKISSSYDKTTSESILREGFNYVHG